MPVITVSNLNDSGAGSLRQAILDAADGDTITIAASGTITLTSGQLVIDKSLTLLGQGAKALTVSGGGTSRVFKVEGAGTTAVIGDLTVSNGFVANLGDGFTDTGGGVHNSGGANLTLERVLVKDNVARGGGGLFSMDGSLKVTGSTFVGNSASAASGGAIANLTNLALIENTTIFGNTARARGGGIVTGVGGDLVLVSSTVAGNTGTALGGGIYSNGGTIFVSNSIIADNTGLGTPSDAYDGANGIYGLNSLIENTVVGELSGVQLIGPIITGVDPRLGPLADNGGPVPTMLPSSTGPAVDAGTASPALATLPTTDARGLPRTYGSRVDLGAVELQAVAIVPSPPTPPPPPALPPSSLPVLASNFTQIGRFQTGGGFQPLPATVTTPDGRVLANPLIEYQKAVAALAAAVDAGTLPRQAALDQIVDLADGRTSVATLSYQFFTGRLPTRAGLDYLVSSPDNPSDLNDGFYAGLSLENRYINFAVNLGKVGEGRANFVAGYGALSLEAATAKAYAEIFGMAADASKLAALLTPDRAGYLLTLGGDALGQKAAMVGWLLAEAAKSDLGPYAAANENFLYDLADGTAAFGADAAIYLGAGPTTVALVGLAEA